MSLGFNIQEKRGKVSYTQKYGNGVVYGTATKSEVDQWDVEVGKALAFARCDALIRKMELEKARRVRKELGNLLEREQRYQALSAEKLYMRHIQEACEYIKILERYYRNQKKIVQFILHLTNTAHDEFLTYQEILQYAHDIVCGQKTEE